MTVHLFQKNSPSRLYKKQRKALDRIIQIAVNTKYGKKYGITKSMKIDQFKNNIPLVNYEKLKPFIDQAYVGENFVLSSEKIESWAFTSGTTSIPKLIPYTKTFTKIYKIAERRFFINIFKSYPSILKGKVLIITGRKCVFKSPNNVIVGSASGIMASGIPCIFRNKIIGMPDELERIDDKYRLEYLFNKAKNNDIRVIASSSSTYVLTLFEIAKEKFGIKGIKKNWPNLKLICCPCGGYSKFHIDKLNKILPYVEIWDTGFGSSEGFLSSSVKTRESIGYPNADLYFFEFIPLNQHTYQIETFLIDEVDCDKPYELVISSPNGLLRYRMNDLVSFKIINGRTAMKYEGRTNLEVSIHGERITENQVLEAVKETKKKLNLNITNFMLLPPEKNVFNKYAYHLIPHSALSEGQNLEFSSYINLS